MFSRNPIHEVLAVGRPTHRDFIVSDSISNSSPPVPSARFM
jgi:hypothetical protein